MNTSASWPGRRIAAATVPGVSVGPPPDPFAYPPAHGPAQTLGGTPVADPYAGYGAYQPGYGPPSYPGWGPPLPPPGPRNRRGTAIGVVAGAVVVVLAVTAVVVGVSRSHHSTLSAADLNALAASRAKIVAELPRLEGWIAQDRGLPFAKPVTPEVLSDDDFVRALDSGGDNGTNNPASDPDDIGTTFAAMGLVKDADT